MKVFKFGGASVKDATAVKNVKTVLSKFNGPVVVVISAMGKTTNALEELVNAYFFKQGDAFAILQKVKKFHFDILDELFPSKSYHPIYNDIHNTFVEIEWEIEEEPQRSYDYVYDQIVAVGELLSTKIVSAFLNEVGMSNHWVDARALIQTDNTYRKANVDWKLSTELVQATIPNLLSQDHSLVITQGFIGSSSENFNTTLGREGSDFSAAIIAYCLDAESVTIWKDVPGMLNADPKWFDDTQQLKHISYYEAVELAYYGATVIHPKTIKPLQNKNIPLMVKSFLNPELKGTLIDQRTEEDRLIPSFIFKMNQVLISISAKDYSFIVEDNLSDIFKKLSAYNITVNLMQNAAISFSICVDFNPFTTQQFIKELQQEYTVLYNEDLELVTIRHYDEATIKRVTENKHIFVEQKSRNTARFVMKDR